MEHSVLDDRVLVLNRCWVAVDTVPVSKAICMMLTPGKSSTTYVATGVELTGDAACPFRPVPWDEWIKLPIREQDRVIHTPRSQVRAPTVIVLANYSKVPMVNPKLTPREVAKRDKYLDIYTGEYVPFDEGNIDHLTPVSKGGRKRDWRNVGWTSRARNSKKGNRFNHEAGLVPRYLPKPPPPRPRLDPERLRTHPDWHYFLKKLPVNSKST